MIGVILGDHTQPFLPDQSCFSVPHLIYYDRVRQMRTILCDRHASWRSANDGLKHTRVTCQVVSEPYCLWRCYKRELVGEGVQHLEWPVPKHLQGMSINPSSSLT